MIDLIPKGAYEIPPNGLGIFRGEYIYTMGEPLILMSCISQQKIYEVESFLLFNGRVHAVHIDYSDFLAKESQPYAREQIQGEALASAFGTSLSRLKGVMSKSVLERPETRYLFPGRIEFAAVGQSEFRIAMCVNRDRLEELRIVREGAKTAALRDYINGILAMSELVKVKRTD